MISEQISPALGFQILPCFFLVLIFLLVPEEGVTDR